MTTKVSVVAWYNISRIAPDRDPWSH